MAKIKEVLDIQRSYSTQVELRSEYFDLERREERMTHYKPIKAHRAAFERIAEGLYRQNNKRSYILSGSFGTGKSHLLMMAASPAMTSLLTVSRSVTLCPCFRMVLMKAVNAETDSNSA